MFEITEETIRDRNFPYEHPLAREIASYVLNRLKEDGCLELIWGNYHEKDFYTDEMKKVIGYLKQMDGFHFTGAPEYFFNLFVESLTEELQCNLSYYEQEMENLYYCEGDPDDYIGECEDSASDYACALNCLNDIVWEDVEKELTIKKYYDTMNLESRGNTMEINLKEMSSTDLEELKKSIDKEAKERKKRKSDELRDKLSAVVQEIEDSGMTLLIVPNDTLYTSCEDEVYQLERREVAFSIE